MNNLEFKQYEIKKDRTSERNEAIRPFVERINAEREGTKYKPLSARAIAIKLGHVPTKDLYGFYKKCDEADSFGRCFFGSLKFSKE